MKYVWCYLSHLKFNYDCIWNQYVSEHFSFARIFFLYAQLGMVSKWPCMPDTTQKLDRMVGGGEPGI